MNSAVVKKSELSSESVQGLQAALDEIESDPRYTVTGTRIISYASPEGGEELNAKLSDRRAESAEKAWDKVTGGMPAGDVQIQSVAIVARQVPTGESVTSKKAEAYPTTVTAMATFAMMRDTA